MFFVYDHTNYAQYVLTAEFVWYPSQMQSLENNGFIVS